MPVADMLVRKNPDNIVERKPGVDMIIFSYVTVVIVV
jgi:hypothetical protein